MKYLWMVVLILSASMVFPQTGSYSPSEITPHSELPIKGPDKTQPDTYPGEKEEEVASPSEVSESYEKVMPKTIPSPRSSPSMHK